MPPKKTADEKVEVGTSKSVKPDKKKPVKEDEPSTRVLRSRKRVEKLVDTSSPTKKVKQGKSKVAAEKSKVTTQDTPQVTADDALPIEKKTRNKKILEVIPEETETKSKVARQKKRQHVKDTSGSKTVKLTEEDEGSTSEDADLINQEVNSQTSLQPGQTNGDSMTKSFYDFKTTDIAGNEVPLSQYEGHVCIIVNVASKCGHTSSNYKELVALHETYAETKGLKILAFPCNQFGNQEPADNKKIYEFVKKKNVKFDMFAKIQVNGQNAHPLWKWLTSQKSGPKGAPIDWNFTKFLIDKDGKVVERFKPSVKPLALVKDLEELF